MWIKRKKCGTACSRAVAMVLQQEKVEGNQRAGVAHRLQDGEACCSPPPLGEWWLSAAEAGQGVDKFLALANNTTVVQDARAACLPSP